MPEHAALVTALIVERPICIRCIAMKADMNLRVLDTTIARIEAVMARSSRCCSPWSLVGVAA
jgi:hypothetical protein